MGVAKTTFLLASLTALLGFFGMALDKMMGTGGIMTVLFLGFGLVTNWVSYFHSDKIVLKMYKAREVSASEAPDLHGMVDRLCARMDLPKPRICIVPSEVPNAFATGRNPKHGVVAVTEGIRRALPPDELEGVIAHELGHIRHRDTLVSTVAASIAGAIGMLAHMGQFGMMFGGGRNEEGGGNPMVLLAMAIAAPIIAMMMQMAISRTREFGADRAAVEATGNPDAMANALRRIEGYATNYEMPVTEGTQHMFIINPLTGSGGMKALFSTHPPTEKRIQAIMRLKQQGVQPLRPMRPASGTR